MIKKRISLIKNKLSKINILKKKNSVYSKLNERYKEKVKLAYLSEVPSKKKITGLLLENKLVVYLNSSKETLLGNSKYMSFHAFLFKNQINFTKIQFNGNLKNSLRNIFEIKLFNDFLVNFAKQNNFSKITIDTWIFEEFNGLSKFMGGFKSSDPNKLIRYHEALKTNDVKKTLSFDFGNNRLNCLTNKGKLINLNVELPSYILKIK